MTSVITTINYPTDAISKLAYTTDLIVVGDKKTPRDWHYGGVRFIDGDEPIGFDIMQFLPENHYARKNIGYLTAIKNKAEVIYDTDDDNTPNDNWKARTAEVEASESVGSGWYNAYNLFSENPIWPRGFSLRHLKHFPSCGITRKFTSSIQQGLADGEPDVDAIWRLVCNKPNSFENNKSIYLKPGAWCPFNSQSTWFFPKAYPLMYLPVTASFRMTDIWRSFIAQRCLWEIGEGVTFHSPSEVFQDRNEHDLLKDLEDEVPGYLKNDLIVDTLNSLQLKQGVENICDNLLKCYDKLVVIDVFPQEEIAAAIAWVDDIQKIWKH